MATYVMLMNWTEKGIKDVSGWSQRVADARKQVEALGGRLVTTYLTMGAYDVIAVVDGVDDEAIARFAMGLGRQGNVRTTTLRAFPEDEAVRLTQGD